ncbi:MAG: metallopeptidase family protein [Myxococcales bacterium]
MTRENTRASPDLEHELDQIDEAFEDGDIERALELTGRLIEKLPGDPDAVTYRASALVSAGEVDEACDLFRQALARAPDDLDLLQAAIELLVYDLEGDHDAYEEALRLLERARKLVRRSRDPGREAELLVLRSAALGGLGDPRGALRAVDEARALAPELPGLAVERGITLFELCRLDEAKAELAAQLEAEPDDARAHHYLGLIAEHQRAPAAAERHFRRARALAPEEYPVPVPMSARDFEKAIEDALERLPPRVHDYLSNVAIIAEDLPDLDELRAAEPPLSPGSLGMFRGTPVTEQSTSDPWSQLPSAILLFRSNLRRFARSRDELIEQIEVTLIHEVGHFLGLDEEQLYERGLD